MHESSPWYLFHPDSPGWIIRRRSNGEHVSRDDVVRIVEAHPESLAEPLVRELVIESLKGRLRKPAGRPPLSIGRKARLMMARELVREQIEEWKRARTQGAPDAPRRVRGEGGLAERAYEKVARQMKLGSGRSLANAISALKSDPLFGE